MISVITEKTSELAVIYFKFLSLLHSHSLSHISLTNMRGPLDVGLPACPYSIGSPRLVWGRLKPPLDKSKLAWL